MTKFYKFLLVCLALSIIGCTSSEDAKEAFKKGNEAYAANDSQKAVEYYEEALDGGLAGGAIKLASMYQHGNGVPLDQQKSRKYIEKAADLDSPIAIRVMGVWYYQGDGVEQDYDKAFELFTKAAEKHDPYAEANLGLMYLNGQGVEKSTKKALEWTKKACENPERQDDQTACMDVAILATGAATN